jgi:hypothetical protein
VTKVNKQVFSSCGVVAMKVVRFIEGLLGVGVRKLVEVVGYKTGDEPCK